MSNFTIRKNIVTKYWTGHNVTNHYNFLTVEDSLDFLDWRNKSYLYYQDLMPTNLADGLVVLDYGCGPGHDLVSFSLNSTPKQLIAADVSETSIKEAAQRMDLHQKKCHFINLNTVHDGSIPLENASIDLINCSGVLHHVMNPEIILKEFRRVLKPTGRVQIMVYNYESIWVHLFVAYELMLKKPSYKRKLLQLLGVGKKYNSLEDAFRQSTDGANCPISRFYKKDEFINILKNSGFSGVFKGASISNWMEMSRLSKRFEALIDRRLPKVHRNFLYDLSFNKDGAPIYNGSVAGIGGCYEAIPL